MVAVAQLVERRIVIPVVAGSIPVGHPISKLSHWFYFVYPRDPYLASRAVFCRAWAFYFYFSFSFFIGSL